MLIPLLLMVGFAAVQEKPAADRPPKRGDTVVVRGCVTGGMIEAGELSARDGDYKHPLAYDYRLTGKKELVATIKKDHAGHVDIVTGVLKTDMPTEMKGLSGRVGNTSIGVGLGGPQGVPPRPLPVLEVSSFEHVDVRCR